MSQRTRRQRRSTSVPVSDQTRDLSRLAPWLLVALAVPRIVRILYPAVWVEDDVLLQCSLAVAKGLRPYVDFAHAQLPLLEWAGGLYIRLAGASHVRMEILNAVAIYATSVLVFLVGRRAVGGRAATAASLLYACHSLVFRYHVWAREFFVTALVLGALAVLVSERFGRARIAVVALLLCAACAVKLTAVVAVAAICACVAVGMRLPRRAIGIAALTGTGIGVFVAFCYWMYGEPFLFQAFLFHFLKGVDSAAGPSYVAGLLDVLGPLCLLGILYMRRQSWSPALGLVVSILAAELLFFVVLSPTAWGHNFLEMWPFVAMLAGAGVAWLIEAWSTSWIRLAAGAAVATACLIWLTPFDNEATLRGAVYGFGFVPRAEVAQLAVALDASTGPGDEVIAPAFIAFEAGRLQAVRYPENIGVMATGDELRRSIGFWEAHRRFGTRSFFDLINETSDIWNKQVARAIAPGGSVNAMIPDSPVQLLPLVNATPEALAARGFHLTLHTEHFAVWIRPGEAIPR
jgi:hypothetical protein